MQRDLMSADIGLAHDDSTMGANGGGSGGGGGLSIGSSEAVINLNNQKGYSTSNPRDTDPNYQDKISIENGKETYRPETPIKENKTQGQHEQDIDYYQRQIEKWNDFLDKGNLKDWHSFMGKLTKDEIALLEKYANENDMPKGKIKANSPEAKALLTNFINHMISNYKNDIYTTKTETDYDNRSDAERRADTATQRAAADYIAAGLNPKALSGFVGGGSGGGGGSSKSDEDEEKRKKRRKEIEEIRRAKHAEQMRQKELVTGIVKSLTDTGVKAVGGAAFMGHQKAMQKTGHQQSLEHTQYKDELYNRNQHNKDVDEYNEEINRYLRSKKPR